MSTSECPFIYCQTHGRSTSPKSRDQSEHYQCEHLVSRFLGRNTWTLETSFRVRKSSSRQEDILERVRISFVWKETSWCFVQRIRQNESLERVKNKQTRRHTWMWYWLEGKIEKIDFPFTSKIYRSEWMRSGKNITGIKLWNVTELFFKRKNKLMFVKWIIFYQRPRHGQDVIIRFKKTTDKVDSWATLKKIRPFFSADKAKKTIRSSREIFDIQTVNCVERHAEVCIKEIDIYIGNHWKTKFPSVLSIGRSCKKHC